MGSPDNIVISSDYLISSLFNIVNNVPNFPYCVMLARLTVDYFRSLLCVPQWSGPEEWDCVLSTIRTSIFSNQNCELTLHDSGDLQLTYLDGDRFGIKKRLSKLLSKRKDAGLNRVSWWGNRGVHVEIKNQYDF